MPPAAKLNSGDVKRTVVLVADDLALSWESTAYLRRALKRYIDTQVGPDDLVSIARTSTGMGALENFTNDKNQLCAAMDAVRWNLNGLGAVNAFEPQTPVVSPIGPSPHGSSAN